MILAALWWIGVATKVLGRDRGVSVGRAEAGRDIDLRSRPGLLKLGAMTWALGLDRGVLVGGAEAGRDIDLRSRPGLLKLGVAT